MGLFLGVYAVVAITILFPQWLRRFDEWSCCMCSRWFVVATLTTTVVAPYSWVYLEGCRRGWWIVLAAWLTDHNT